MKDKKNEQQMTIYCELRMMMMPEQEHMHWIHLIYHQRNAKYETEHSVSQVHLLFLFFLFW